MQTITTYLFKITENLSFFNENLSFNTVDKVYVPSAMNYEIKVNIKHGSIHIAFLIHMSV